MTTYNATSDSTTDHRQDDCRCPDDRCAGKHHPVGETCWCTRSLDADVEKIVASAEVVDLGEYDLGTYIEYDDSPEIRTCVTAALSNDRRTVRIWRDSAIRVLDTELPAIPPLSDDDTDLIVRQVANEAVYNGLQGVRWEADLTADLKRIDQGVACPDWCVGDGECFSRHTASIVEHSAKVVKLDSPGFRAESRLECIVQTSDPTADLDPTFMPQVEIADVEFPPVTLHLQPEDLRKLGQFLIEQAGRFESMIQEVEVQA